MTLAVIHTATGIIRRTTVDPINTITLDTDESIVNLPPGYTGGMKAIKAGVLVDPSQADQDIENIIPQSNENALLVTSLKAITTDNTLPLKIRTMAVGFLRLYDVTKTRRV